MLRNYIKITFRNLWKDRIFSGLNVLGLSVAFCIATLLIISGLNSLSVNQFHENKNNLYQVYATQQTPKGPSAVISKPTPFAPTLKEEVLGIGNITRHLEENAIVFKDDKDFQLDASYVDEDFLKMFTYPVIKGDRHKPLSDLTSAVITEETAKRLFNSVDVVGKPISLQKDNSKTTYQITAVLKDIPDQSTMNFDILLRFEVLPFYKDTIDEWSSSFHNVYLQLTDGVTVQEFEERTRVFVAKHYKETIENAERDGIVKDENGQVLQFRLHPYADYAFVNFEAGIATVSRTTTYLVIGIALLILCIASINFINMRVAKGGQRLREIGMRKTLGASKYQLFCQLWLESVFVYLISLCLGLLLAYAVLGEFQAMFRTSGNFQTLFKTDVIIYMIMSFIVITILSGGYPAYLSSKLGTLKALKGKLEAKEGSRLRNVLIVIQFSIAIVLISSTIVLSKQINHLRNKDLGFDKNNVVSIPLNGGLDSKLVVNRLRNSLENESFIISVSAADNNLGRGKDGSSYSSMSGFDYNGRGIKTNGLIVDYDYVKTLGLELISGRSFDRSFSSDSLSMVINESMVKEYGEENPLEIRVMIYDNIYHKVIGVVKDYDFKGVKAKTEPLTFFLDNTTDFYYAFVKVKPARAVEAFEKIEAVWKTIEPNAPFLGSFLNENIDRTLRREKRLAKIITSGSVVAILLSCIGLFAISLIVVNQRTKEIGIRKIVGASVLRLIQLLLSDFVKLVVIAFVIATPVAWWLSSEWLNGYSYRINLNIGVFVFAGCIAIVIAILTIGYKTLRAATANPVKSLRTE